MPCRGFVDLSLKLYLQELNFSVRKTKLKIQRIKILGSDLIWSVDICYLFSIHCYCCDDELLLHVNCILIICYVYRSLFFSQLLYPLPTYIGKIDKVLDTLTHLTLIACAESTNKGLGTFMPDATKFSWVLLSAQIIVWKIKPRLLSNYSSSKMFLGLTWKGKKVLKKYAGQSKLFSSWVCALLFMNSFCSAFAFTSPSVINFVEDKDLNN